MRRGLRVVTAVALAVLTAALVFVIAVDPPWTGPTVVRFTRDHGLHRGDVWALGVWLVGAAACAAVWSLTGARGTASHPAPDPERVP